MYMRLLKDIAQKIAKKRTLRNSSCQEKRLFFQVVQGVREKCLMLGTFHLLRQVSFPLSPTLLPLASGWIRPMGDPQKELRGREENRAKAFFYWLQMQCHLRVTDWPCLSSGGHSPPVQLPLQFPKTAASPVPSDLKMAMALCCCQLRGIVTSDICNKIIKIYYYPAYIFVDSPLIKLFSINSLNV